METGESNKFGKFMVPQDESLSRPLLPHWTTSMQAYYNSGSTPTPFLNPHAAGPYFYPYMWPNQTNNPLLQCDAQHDPGKLSNKPQDAALAFSEIVHRTFGEQNLDLKKGSDRNLQHESLVIKGSRELQHESLVIKGSRESGSRSSLLKNNSDGMSRSAASGSKGSPDEGHDTNNDFPSTKKQQSNMMLENENSTELTQNLETGLKESSSNVQPIKMEEDEIRKERKRQSNRESAKRSRIRKQQECEELRRNIDSIKDENSSLAQMLKRLSEECLELSNENDSLQEELIEMYGPESIADLLPMKPA